VPGRVAETCYTKRERLSLWSLGRAEMDFQAWVAVLALVVAAVSLYYQRKQTLMANASTKMGAARHWFAKPQWWKTPSIPVLIFLVALAWAPLFMQDGDENINISNPSWGLYNHDNTWSTLHIGGDFSSLYSKFSDKYRIIACAAQFTGRIDPSDAEGLQKSAVYDLRPGRSVFLIETDETFRKNVASGMRGTRYFLFLLPPSIKADQFKTIRQATALGKF
jgi:hypothetical protein